MKKFFLFILVFSFLCVPSVSAFTVRTNDSIVINQGQSVQGNLYLAGERIRIDGNVDGDIFCAGREVIINGQVSGDIFCAGQKISINGEVRGSVRMAGESIVLGKNTRRNVMVFGQNFVMKPTVTVGEELLFAAQKGQVQGTVSGDINGAGKDFKLDGTAGRNVSLRVASLALGKDAKIRGNLGYEAETEATLGPGQVGGKVQFKKVQIDNPKDLDNSAKSSIQIGSILSFLLIGLVFVLGAQAHLGQPLEMMQTRPWATLGRGVLVLILTPILAMLFFITIIGIPLAVAVILMWIVALILSRVLAGIVLGKVLLQEFLPNRQNNLYLAALVGIPLLFLTIGVPLVGGIVMIVSVLYGLGGITYFFKPVEINKVEVIEKTPRRSSLIAKRKGVSSK